MSLRPVRQVIQTQADDRGSRSQTPASIRLRQNEGLRSLPARSMTFVTTIRTITSPDSPGTRTAESRPSPTCWLVPSNTATASEIKARCQPGDVQWMTAGSGILHQEMPKGDPQGRMHGFQLWANLPSHQKMTDPRYQDIPSSAIPEVTDDDGTRVRIICGEFWGQRGPVEGVAADPNYLDISVPPGKKKRLKVETTRNAFAYVFAGAGTFRDSSGPQAVLTENVMKPDAAPTYDVGNHSLVLFDRGDEVVVQAGPEGIRFLLVSGKPLEEPVAWHGPIVMNTQDQLREAIRELNQGTFIKHQ